MILTPKLKERNTLHIKKLISLLSKKNCLYILIETEESKNTNFKIYKDETGPQSPLFLTYQGGDPTVLREGEIYNITNEKFLDNVIHTDKYSQIILFDKGYLYEKIKPNIPVIYLILNRNEKNDIYIYTPSDNNSNNNLINFVCEDDHCKAEGILDIEKNNFSIIKEHQIQHKDYHINDDIHFSAQFFWSFIFKYREIKTLQIVLLPPEYDLKMIYNFPLLLTQKHINFNNTNNNIHNNKNIFSTVKEKEKEKINNINIQEKKEEKIFELKKDYNNKDNSLERNNIFLGKTKSKSPPILFNSVNCGNNNNNDINKNNKNNKKNYFLQSNNLAYIDDIDSYKCPSEINQSINDNIENNNNNTNEIFKLEKAKEKKKEKENEENIGKNKNQSRIVNIFETQKINPDSNLIKEKESKNEINNIENNKLLELDEEEEKYDGDSFSLSGSEEIFRDCFINSKKRRKIVCCINFMIHNNKIYENEDLKEFQLNEDTLSYCSQCIICVQSKSNNNNIETYNYNNNYNEINNSLNQSLNASNKNILYEPQDMITYSTPENDFLQKKKNNNINTTNNNTNNNSGSKYKKKEFHFFPSKKNQRLFYAKIYLDSHKECRSNDRRKDQWLKYFEVKYGKNHKLGMHFHRDDKTGKIYGYQNRHLEVGYYDKRLVYYCLNRCPGNGRFDCEKEIFFVDKPHSCNNGLSTQQSEIVKFFEENPRVNDIQIIRVFSDK